MQNNEEYNQNAGPIRLAFLHVLAFHESGKSCHPWYCFLSFWRHLVDLGSPCNVEATADTFGYWQVGATTLKKMYWQNLAGWCSAWKITKIKRKGTNWNQHGANVEPKGSQNTSANPSGTSVWNERLPDYRFGAPLKICHTMLAPLGWFWIPFWRPLDFGGSIH